MHPFIILIIVIIIITIFVHDTIKETEHQIEAFTVANNMQGPLLNYDDYGTFNFLFHTDDLPYYDPTYEWMGCDFTNWDGADPNEYIKYDGDHKLRRRLIGSNYVDLRESANAKFDTDEDHILIKKNRVQASAYPPQPHNFYFGKVEQMSNCLSSNDAK